MHCFNVFFKRNIRGSRVSMYSKYLIPDDRSSVPNTCPTQVRFHMTGILACLFVCFLLFFCCPSLLSVPMYLYISLWYLSNKDFVFVFVFVFVFGIQPTILSGVMIMHISNTLKIIMKNIRQELMMVFIHKTSNQHFIDIHDFNDFQSPKSIGCRLSMLPTIIWIFFSAVSPVSVN